MRPNHQPRRGGYKDGAARATDAAAQKSIAEGFGNQGFIFAYVLRHPRIVDKLVDKMCIYCVNNPFLYTRKTLITCFFTCIRRRPEE